MLHKLNAEIYKLEQIIFYTNLIIEKLQRHTHLTNNKLYKKYSYLYKLREYFYLKLIKLDSKRYKELILNNLPLYSTKVIL